MRNFLKSCKRALAVGFELSISIVGIAMLLSFPANSSHSFAEHFRTNEVRNSIVRHAFVAGPEADGAQAIAHFDAEPTIPMPVIIESAAKPLDGFGLSSQFSSEVSFLRLIQRFKLGSSSSGGPDPLL
jgi:hypothetical protein